MSAIQLSNRFNFEKYARKYRVKLTKLSTKRRENFPPSFLLLLFFFFWNSLTVSSKKLVESKIREWKFVAYSSSFFKPRQSFNFVTKNKKCIKKTLKLILKIYRLYNFSIAIKYQNHIIVFNVWKARSLVVKFKISFIFEKYTKIKFQKNCIPFLPTYFISSKILILLFCCARYEQFNVPRYLSTRKVYSHKVF